MRIFWVAAFAGTMVAAAMGAGVARVQLQTQSGLGTQTQSKLQQRSTSPSTLPSIDGQPVDDNDPLGPMREARRVRAVANDRQRKIVDETSRLLELATELNAEPEKAPAKTETPDAVRKLDEIERLAHDVKQRMKG